MRLMCTFFHSTQWMYFLPWVKVTQQTSIAVLVCARPERDAGWATVPRRMATIDSTIDTSTIDTSFPNHSGSLMIQEQYPKRAPLVQTLVILRQYGQRAECTQIPLWFSNSLDSEVKSSPDINITDQGYREPIRKNQFVLFTVVHRLLFKQWGKST